ncbi:hypothetical protein GW17_00056034 [Ensete ventricosum]|nr:hypothetical protein GW17_00056034 [Ensete ventricosum]
MAGGSEERCCEAMFWVYLIISVGLVLFAGLMSGLTLGLMSLSLVDLEVLVKAGKPKDQLHAGLLPPASLSAPSPLFFYSVTLTTLLCFLFFSVRSQDSTRGQESASPALHPAHRQLARHGVNFGVCVFGFSKIIPQAVCSRYGLSVGAKTAGVVRLLLLIFFPVAYPISKVITTCFFTCLYPLDLFSTSSKENKKQKLSSLSDLYYNVIYIELL